MMMILTECYMRSFENIIQIFPVQLINCLSQSKVYIIYIYIHIYISVDTFS